MGITRIMPFRRLRQRTRLLKAAPATETTLRSALARMRDRPPDVYLLMEHLLAQKRCLPQHSIDRITTAFVSDPAALAALVSVIIRPDTSPASDANPVRDRISSAWCAANLITFGPPELAEAICKRPDLLRKLVSVFEVEPDTINGAVAALSAKVLQFLATLHARVVAEVFAQESVITGCVHNVTVQPASDTLVRMVGTRLFSSEGTNGAVLPAHRKCVAALAQHRVQSMLATRFTTAAAECSRQSSSAHAVCEAAASTMAEMSVRAAAVRRMFEDPDERCDGGLYLAHLSVVPAHVFNDARAYIMLAESPEPLTTVLDCALNLSNLPEVIVPALQMAHAVVSSCGEATMPLDAQLVARVPSTLNVLSTLEGRVLGRTRLALVDILVALLKRPVQIMSQVVELGAVDALLELLAKFPNHSVLHTRVESAISSLLSGKSRVFIVTHSSIVKFWLDHHSATFVALHSNTLSALWTMLEQEQNNASQVSSDKERFAAAFEQRISEWTNRQTGLFEETAHKQKDPVPGKREAVKSHALTEDVGHQLYVHAMIEQANASNKSLLGKEVEHGLEVCGTALVRAKALVGSIHVH